MNQHNLDKNLEEYDLDIKDINMDDIKISYNGDTEIINDIKTEILSGKFKKISNRNWLNFNIYLEPCLNSSFFRPAYSSGTYFTLISGVCRTKPSVSSVPNLGLN